MKCKEDKVMKKKWKKETFEPDKIDVFLSEKIVAKLKKSRGKTRVICLKKYDLIKFVPNGANEQYSARRQQHSNYVAMNELKKKHKCSYLQ